jgi:hypothetical protein
VSGGGGEVEGERGHIGGRVAHARAKEKRNSHLLSRW